MCINERTTAIDAKLTIAPPPRASSGGIAAWHMKNAVLKLTASSRSSASGCTSVNGPKLKNPPATFTRMSRPPNCDCTAAAAACAASGCVRSPAEALAAMPSAANSLTRSARPTALTSASNSLAPARPSPRATACPICPTRPTPVTRATFPQRSAGTDDVIHRGSTALREVHRAVAPDDVHGPLDTLAVVLQGVVRRRNRAVGIGEQRKIELEFLDVALVTVHACRVHAQRLHLGCVEFVDLIAHGGELAVSAGGVVARIEDERYRPALEQILQCVGAAVRRRGGELRRLAADRQRFAHGLFLALSPSRCSSCCSHTSGTFMPPSGACDSPYSLSPCQSDPPVMPSPKRSATRMRRCSRAGGWLGWRTSMQSSPWSWKIRSWASLPWSPRCAAAVNPPTSCTSAVTSASLGSGFPT